MEGGDAQSEGTSREPTADPTEREEDQPMETTPPTSPVSPNEDDLLTGATATTSGVEVELASLRVASSPEDRGDHPEASG